MAQCAQHLGIRLVRQHVFNKNARVVQVGGHVHVRHGNQGILKSRIAQLGADEDAQLFTEHLGDAFLTSGRHL